MEKKNYKVVCSKLKFADEIFVDIASSGGVIHDQIFFSRAQLCKDFSSQPLERVTGSVYLEALEQDGQPEEVKIYFPQTANQQKNPLEYADMQRLHARLTPLIEQTYQQMRAEGRESTLFVYGVAEMNALQEEARQYNGSDSDGDGFEQRAKRRRAQFAVKHTSPQTPQEERLQKMATDYARACKRRVYSEEKRGQETEPTWLRHQREYDGD